jgi:protein gp37
MMHNPTTPVTHREVYAGNAAMRMHHERSSEPLTLRKPRVIATQFMGDLGQADDECQQDVFMTIAALPEHKFIVLTKWPEKIKEDVPDNCWVGTSITDQATADARIPKLLEVKAVHKWVSVEPMLGPVNMGKWLPELGFIACGPETGTGARGYTAQWMINLSNDCRHTAVPFYDKRDEDSLLFERREWPEEWNK